MVIKNMPLFWAILDLSDLQYPVVLWLVSVAIGWSESITLAFRYSIATMNPIAVVTFFHETCRDIFKHLLRAESSNGGIFVLISAYFGTIETNGRGMLHLHCLVWLKRISSFFNLQRKVVDEDGFKIRLLSFLDQVIRCELIFVDINQVLLEVGPLASATNDASVFALQLKDNVNLVTSEV